MCELLRVARERAGLDSNNKVAIALGVSPELVSRWETNKSKPNGINTLKLMKLGNIERDEGIKLSEKGSASLLLIFITALVCIALLAPHYAAVLCILC